jgi:hypothetical protein
MSLPGFTAENSLTESTWNYYGARSLGAASEDAVDPEFLGVIKEFFQSAGSALSTAIVSAASGLGDAISKLAASGGGGGRPFVCNQWATAVLACSGGQPAYSEAELMSRCVSMNPSYMAVCAAASAGLYPLMQQACSQNPGQIGTLVGQICK